MLDLLQVVAQLVPETLQALQDYRSSGHSQPVRLRVADELPVVGLVGVVVVVVVGLLVAVDLIAGWPGQARASAITRTELRYHHPMVLTYRKAAELHSTFDHSQKTEKV